ncbi:hypothetical protein MMC18_008297 [Xylographa bjoerkii]|nr:hypothetical protein [Xylographa bjoerkii]
MRRTLPPTEDTTARETVCLAQSLSNEVLATIFALLDSPAPSTSGSRHQPNLQLTTCNSTILKSLSCVCRGWRPVALRILFSHTRFLLQYGVDAPRPNLNTEVKPFLDFIRHEGLVRIVESFVLGISDGVEEANYRSRDSPPLDIVSFWPNLFRIIDPASVVIVAPPLILGSLTFCSVNSYEILDFHMPYHILSLSRPRKQELCQWDPLEPSRRYSPCHKNALFNIRPWTSLLLNEGSFLRAYSFPDAERRWRTPPSILCDLVGAKAPHPKALIPSTVRTFSYIAVFPFWGHFAYLIDNFPRLNRLYLQFVPINELAPDYWQRAQVDVLALTVQRDYCYDELLNKLLQHTLPTRYRLLEEVELGGAATDSSWSAVEKKIEDAIANQRLDWRMEEKGILRRDPHCNASVSSTYETIKTDQPHAFPETRIARRHSLHVDLRVNKAMHD